jgi:Sel1 repeat-containing protein/GAF domain-containing protein
VPRLNVNEKPHAFWQSRLVNSLCTLKNNRGALRFSGKLRGNTRGPAGDLNTCLRCVSQRHKAVLRLSIQNGSVGEGFIMAQRFSLDHQSFEQFLAAASLLQQFQRQATQSSGPQNFAYHLLELLDTQKAIESGALDTDSAIERIVRLALRVLGAEGTAAWLFSNDEFVYRAGSGRAASKDERLRLTVLARVAAICEPSRESFPGQREWAKGAGDSGYYPGCVRSLIVGPIYRHDRVVGALAGFSTAFDAFDERDAANIRLLSGMIGTAMERAVVPDISVAALPRQTLLRVIEHIVPALEQLVHEQDSARQGTEQEPIIHEESVPNFVSLQSPLEVSSFGGETQNLSRDAGVPAVEITNVEAEAVTEPEPMIPAAERIDEIEDVTAEAIALPPEPIVAVRSVQEEPAALMQSAATTPEEQHPEVVKAAALRDELAQLSRSIAEMVERRESPSADLAAGNVAAPGVQDPTPVPLETDSEQETFSSATSIHESETAEEAEVQRFTPMDDTAVPGIGVRAALYDDEEEQPSQLWVSLRNTAAHAARAVSNLAGSTFRFMQRSASWTTSSGRQFGSRVREKAQFRPKMPKLPTERLDEVTRRARATLSNQASNVRVRVQGLTSRRLELPKISTAKMRNVTDQTSTSLRKAAASVADTCKALVNSVPDLPSFSRNSLHNARPSAAVAEQRTDSRINRLQNFRLRVRVNGTTLRRSASALAILLVMSAFLLMESGLFRSDSTAAASARNETQTVGGANRAPTERPVSTNVTVQTSNVATHKASAATGPTSHLLITDPSTEDIVQNLTRFEVSTVRRQAATGDEEAAFQLGMMYEVGYDVKQNCSKAAEWVTKAAEAGYPPAQYNLGLRYKDGDGVTASTAEAEKWLNKAAAGKYRPARVALAKLLPQDR